MKHFRLLVAFLILIPSLGSFSQQQSYRSSWVLPTPQGSNVRGMYFTDSMHGFLAGDYLTIHRTSDGGQSWWQAPVINKPEQEPGRLIDQWFLGQIHFKNSDEGVVYTSRDALLTTRDGGKTWQYTRPKEFENAHIGSIERLNDTTLVAFGQLATIRSTDGGFTWKRGEKVEKLIPTKVLDAGEGTYLGIGRSLYRSTDKGQTWQEHEQELSTDIDVGHLNKDGVGFIAGHYGAHYTSNRGVSWSGLISYQGIDDDPSVYLALPIDDSISIMTVATQVASSLYDPNGFILRTTDAGQTWNRIIDAPNAVFYVGTEHPDGRLFLAGSSGTIAQSTDCGLTWSVEEVNERITFRSIVFTTPATGVAVGRLGAVVVTSDGGMTWTELFPYKYQQLNDVSFTGAGTGIAVGNDSTILRTTDDGTTWSALPEIQWKESWRGSSDFQKVRFVDSLTGYILGNGTGNVLRAALLRTTDAGASWSEFYNNVFYEAEDFAVFGDSDFLLVGQKKGASGFQVGFILRSSDGGETWEEIVESVPPAPLTSVVMHDEVHGMAVGEESLIMFTEDGGKTWSINSHKKDGVSRTFYDLQMSYKYEGYAVYDLGVVRVLNRGKEWSNIYRTFVPLFSFEFQNDSSAMFVGGWGTTLITSDKGRSWDSAGRLSLLSLYGVALNSAGEWYAVGNGGAIIRIGVDTNTVPDTSSAVAADNRVHPSNGISVTTSVRDGVVEFRTSDLPAGKGRFSIYTIHGELIATPFVGTMTPGAKSWPWYVQSLPSGSYLYLLEFQSNSETSFVTGKMNLVQ